MAPSQVTRRRARAPHSWRPRIACCYCGQAARRKREGRFHAICPAHAGCYEQLQPEDEHRQLAAGASCRRCSVSLALVSHVPSCRDDVPATSPSSARREPPQKWEATRHDRGSRACRVMLGSRGAGGWGLTKALCTPALRGCVGRKEDAVTRRAVRCIGYSAAAGMEPEGRNHWRPSAAHDQGRDVRGGNTTESVPQPADDRHATDIVLMRNQLLCRDANQLQDRIECVHRLLRDMTVSGQDRWQLMNTLSQQAMLASTRLGRRTPIAAHVRMYKRLAAVSVTQPAETTAVTVS